MEVLLIELFLLWLSSIGMLLILIFYVARNGRDFIRDEELLHKNSLTRAALRTTGSAAGIMFEESKKIVLPPSYKVLSKILDLLTNLFGGVYTRFERFTDFIKGRGILEKKGGVSLYLKNIVVHKDENNKKVSEADKMRMVD